MKDLKVVFMGTPDFSVPILDYLIKNTNVVLVVTQPDKIVGKSNTLSFSPIKKLAVANNIKVFQPVKIRLDYKEIFDVNPDIIITCAYGQIIPEELINLPRLGCINVHASLLPKYRGSSPIQWCLLNGEEKTGVTIMYMDKNMDTGDMISKVEYTILPEDNVGTLHDKLSILGKDLLAKTLPEIVNGTNKREKQDDNLAPYTKMIKREDELLDFDDKGINIINKIRAFNPWPLCYFKLNDLEIKVIKASFNPKNNSKVGKVTITKKDIIIECLDGEIHLEKVKPFGKKEMDSSSYVNGLKKDISYHI